MPCLRKPYDIIELSLNDSGQITIQIDHNVQNIPTNPNDNTAGLAAMALLNAKKLNTGIHINIIKNMSSGGGMGTTGASAGATIFGLDKLFSLGLSNNELIDFARRGRSLQAGHPMLIMWLPPFWVDLFW
ncbi:MAG: hypothetical protein R2750_01020 [Bacteroidales bacterium]